MCDCVPDCFFDFLDNKGELHREGGGPASICLACGTKCWYAHGKPQRGGDLPTVVLSDGTQLWHRGTQWHRDNNLPAIIHPDGKMSWYVNDVKTGNQNSPPPGAVFPGQLVKSAGKR